MNVTLLYIEAPFGFQQTIVLVDKALADKTIIGANSVCKYIFLKAFNGSSSLAEHWNDAVNQLVDIEETLLVPAITKQTTGVSIYV
jgi:hypothetical protein